MNGNAFQPAGLPKPVPAPRPRPNKEKKMYIAAYDYRPNEEGDLELTAVSVLVYSVPK